MSDAIEDKLREALAEYAHVAWSGWMKYMFEKGKFEYRHKDGGGLIAVETVYVMPAWAVERWARQMNTEFSALPAEEQKSDYEEADKILSILSASNEES